MSDQPSKDQQLEQQSQLGVKEFSTPERKRRIIAMVLLRSYSYPLRKEIADAGFQKFDRSAKPQLNTWLNNEDEYREIFDVIVASVRPSWQIQSLRK